MSRKSRLKFDEIGFWSEVKLAIIKDYASAYTTIMSVQNNPSFTYIYIDAFAGAGRHKSKKTGEFVAGSPLNALNIHKQFKEYHFIDLEDLKSKELKKLASQEKNVFVYNGDCNEILPQSIFPRACYNDYKRALCILDPYGLHLNWEIIETAGKMKSMEIFLNFPVMDINMNVLKHDQSKVENMHRERMNAFWGDDSWKQLLYTKSEQVLLPGFGEAPDEKVTNEKLELAFRKRLKEVAGFSYVPPPMPMKNSKDAIVYYLYFASQKPVAKDIVQSIFKKYSDRKG